MILKVAIPGKMQFKMIRKENIFLRRKGEIHYIGGAEVLPPPLEMDKESQVISDLGTEVDAEAKAILIEHNLRLVVYIAKKFDNTGVGVEDLISIGTIGLIKSINTFNPEKKIKLATYCSMKAILSEAFFALADNHIAIRSITPSDNISSMITIAFIITILIRTVKSLTILYRLPITNLHREHFFH